MTKIGIAGLLVAGLFFSFVYPASAQVMMQAQQMSVSSNAAINCNGSCDAQANGSASGSQWQYMDAAPAYAAPARAYVAPRARVVRPRTVRRTYQSSMVYVTEIANGSARVNWGYRGGTCHVRYTEQGESWYKYQTAASCDDGGVTIGALVSGQRYVVQVRQENGGWSYPVVVTAW